VQTGYAFIELLLLQPVFYIVLIPRQSFQPQGNLLMLVLNNPVDSHLQPVVHRIFLSVDGAVSICL
jgi:hypothetical protein